MYVVGGENSFRFCPRYPTLNAVTVRDLIRDSQKNFYALDLTKTEIDLISEGENAAVTRYRIKDAEEDGTLDHSASTYMIENDELVPGIYSEGPRIIDFANILKYNYIPLAETLQILLRLFKEALGSPVEIEYAVDLTNTENNLPTFYLLQIKPLIRVEEQVEIDLDIIDRDQVIMYAEMGMGNGIIESITDVVYVDPDNFDKTRTREMAAEISRINHNLEKEGRDYILIGPGRWGSKDPYTGIPVLWANISRARIIVEMGLPDFPLDASLGSHFFHNVTSMNVGYFSVPHKSKSSYLKMNELIKQKVIDRTEFIRHIQFEKPLSVLMNGKERRALIHL